MGGGAEVRPDAGGGWLRAAAPPKISATPGRQQQSSAPRQDAASGLGGRRGQGESCCCPPCRNLDPIISLPGGESLRGFILVTFLVEKAAVPGIKVGREPPAVPCSCLAPEPSPRGCQRVPRAHPSPSIALCSPSAPRRRSLRPFVPSGSSTRRPCTRPCRGWRRPSGPWARLCRGCTVTAAWGSPRGAVHGAAHQLHCANVLVLGPESSS